MQFQNTFSPLLEGNASGVILHIIEKAFLSPFIFITLLILKSLPKFFYFYTIGLRGY